jgi:putative addiction module killer protein
LIEHDLFGKPLHTFPDHALARGNRSQVKGLGGGVAELKLDYGPGYRVYFGQDGATLVILLGGGTKTRQDDDIATAKSRWSDYKARKVRERE